MTRSTRSFSDRCSTLIACALFGWGAGCLDDTPDADGRTSDADSDTGGSDADGSGAAHWFLTCGDPVCRGWTETSGIALCTTERVGDACDSLGATCDPKDDCNARLLCATSDPTQQPGGCPISRREAKDDIAYLDEAGLLRVLDQVLATRLATWRYRWEPGRERLGFIIDD